MVPKPRSCRYLFMPCPPDLFPDGTWLEPEELAYPHGGFTRRAYATCPDGHKRLCLCSIPDTLFTIPARLCQKGKRIKGFLTISEDHQGIQFHPTKED